jgi:hypothetical protein
MLKQSCPRLLLGVLGAFGAAFLVACAPPSSSSLVAVAAPPAPPAPPFIPSAQDRPTGLWAQAVWDINIFPVWNAPEPPLLPGKTYGFYTIECTYEHHHGQASSRCVERTSPFSPAEKVWVDRLQQCFRLTHRPFREGKEMPSDPDAFRLLVNHSIATFEEIESYGCESAWRDDRPCTPMKRKTGKIIHQNVTSGSLSPPKGGKMGYSQLSDTMNVFPPTMVHLSFFSPRYPSAKGGLVEDGRFVYDGNASDSEIRALMQRLEAIGAGTDIELVRAAVVLDRALLAVRLRDERLVADMAGEIKRFLERTTLDKEDAEHWSSSGSYRYYVREELQRALDELKKITAGSVLLQDPCGVVAVPTSARSRR